MLQHVDRTGKKINAVPTPFILTCSRHVLCMCDMFCIAMSFYIFMYVSSLNFHKSHVTLVSLLFPLYKWKFWGSEKLRNCRGESLEEGSRGHSDSGSLPWRWWGGTSLPPMLENSSCRSSWEGHLWWLRWLCSQYRLVHSPGHHRHSPESPQQPPNWSQGTGGLPHLQSDLKRAPSKIQSQFTPCPPPLPVAPFISG